MKQSQTKHNSLVLIGSAENPAWLELFQTAADNLQCVVTLVPIDQIDITLGKYKVNLGKHHDKIVSADAIVFLQERYERNYYYLSLLLPDNIRILNRTSILKFPTLADKFIQYAFLHKQVNTGQVFLPGAQEKNKLLPSLPAIAKSLGASDISFGSRGIFKIDSQSEAEELMQTRWPIVFQEQCSKDPDIDYRTIILNGIELGTAKRERYGEGKKSWSQFSLDKTTAQKFIDITHQLNLEFCAFDYGLDDGETILYEVNRFPFFKRFSEELNIDVARQLLFELTKK